MTAPTLDDLLDDVVLPPAPLDMANAPTVYGLDLSLNSTGISNGTTAEALRPKNLAGHDRIEWQRRAIAERIPTHTDLVVIEGPAFSKGYQPGVEEMGWLRGVIQHDLYRRRIPYAICPPNQRTIYACGVANPAKDHPAKGRALIAKGMVRDAVQQRYGIDCDGVGRYDQADAVIFAAMGLHWLGYPLAVVADSHRRALAQVQWPVIVPAVAR